MKTPLPIGANVQYTWPEAPADTPTRYGYVSFGAFIESLGADSFGVSDDDILYYAESEDELRNLTGSADFIVHSYKLIYRGEQA